MLFGHNSDVKLGDAVYHVQTEDRGPATALIDTTVYSGGRVLHRRTNNYLDLLPLDAERESLLRQRIDDQHRGITEEIRSGGLKLVAASPAKANPSAQKPGAVAPSAQPTAPGSASAAGTSAQELALELLNAKTWLSGKRASLLIVVRQKQNGAVLAGANVVAHVDGSADGAEFSGQSGADGVARIEFDMPRIASAEPALVIEAAQGASKAQLKFQLRARPRVPA